MSSGSPDRSISEPSRLEPADVFGVVPQCRLYRLLDEVQRRRVLYHRDLEQSVLDVPWDRPVLGKPRALPTNTTLASHEMGSSSSGSIRTRRLSNSRSVDAVVIA